MSKDNIRLSRLGVLAPAALSACMDASVLAVPAAGAIVSTVLKELSKAFMLKKWFHGSMSAKEAEHLMMERGKNGSFLVRESRAHPGDFVLTVRVRGRVSHVMIKKQYNKYDVGSGEQFDDLVGLIEHFRLYPIIESSGDVLKLLQPISGNYFRTFNNNYKDVKMQESIDNVDFNKKKDDLEDEFSSLEKMDLQYNHTTLEAVKNANLRKNRYRNIMPYDHTRVILQRDEKITGSDYINANYIYVNDLNDSLASVGSSNESIDSVQSLKVRSKVKKHLPLVKKSLSDEALKELKRCLKMDKINKNINNGTVSNKAYIATQGCLPYTKGDFWRMIWQDDVRIIVMITNIYENDKKKCEKYWPEEGNEQFEDINVRFKVERSSKDYIVREFDVTDKGNVCRTIYQYHYTAWPDHGTPTKPASLLAFIVDMNKKMNSIMQTNKPEKNIICVHCSAGVGRTGTFIVLDILIDKINAMGVDCDIDICKTVKLVRSQRYGMVQNINQYKFIYTALQEFIDSIDKGNEKALNMSDLQKLDLQ